MIVAEEIKQQLRPGKLFINGGWEDAGTGRAIDVVNPATGEPLTTVPEGAVGGIVPWNFGRHLGSYALEQYTNVKSVWVAL